MKILVFQCLCLGGVGKIPNFLLLGASLRCKETFAPRSCLLTPSRSFEITCILWTALQTSAGEWSSSRWLKVMAMLRCKSFMRHVGRQTCFSRLASHLSTARRQHQQEQTLPRVPNMHAYPQSVLEKLPIIVHPRNELDIRGCVQVVMLSSNVWHERQERIKLIEKCKLRNV